MASPEEHSGVLEARNTSPVSTLSSSTGGSAAKVSDSSTAGGGLKDTENEPEPEAMSGGTEDTGVVFAAEGTDAAAGGTDDDGRRKSGRIRGRADCRDCRRGYQQYRRRYRYKQCRRGNGCSCRRSQCSCACRRGRW